jgi:hypothetical protein
METRCVLVVVGTEFLNNIWMHLMLQRVNRISGCFIPVFHSTYSRTVSKKIRSGTIIYLFICNVWRNTAISCWEFRSKSYRMRHVIKKSLLAIFLTLTWTEYKFNMVEHCAPKTVFLNHRQSTGRQTDLETEVFARFLRIPSKEDDL